jgi:PPK2 family polyphosphate:nucleotide phosphotransferase
MSPPSHEQHHSHISGPIGALTQVSPNSEQPLHGIDPSKTQPDAEKKLIKGEIKKLRHSLQDLQRRLWGAAHDGVIIVLQGLDTAGKDGTIRRVFDGINPQGVTVNAFRVPTPEEAGHDFLWRIHSKVPARGTITIFNRSHYEDLVVPRVFATLTQKEWELRIKQTLEFEHYLQSQGIHVIKFFLHISPQEQQRRLEERLDDPAKHWKFSSADLATRQRWYDFQDAYDQVISQTSTQHAPWHIIPANVKWYRDFLVLGAVEELLTRIDPQYPATDLDHLAALRKDLHRPLPRHSRSTKAIPS